MTDNRHFTYDGDEFKLLNKFKFSQIKIESHKEGNTNTITNKSNYVEKYFIKNQKEKHKDLPQRRKKHIDVRFDK